MKWPLDLSGIKGFLATPEAEALFTAAREQARSGPCLEIGSYCGKSAVCIGSACAAEQTLLFSVDHHRGSEENQPGWPYFDPEVWDSEAEAVDTLPLFRRTIRQAGLESSIVPIIGRSADIAKFWRTPLSFLFIDGGHTTEHALNDYRGWTPHLQKGGILAIHDVFPDPADGGQAPFEIYQKALASGLFIETGQVMSLRLLRRL